MPGSNLSADENKAKHRGRAYQCLRCLQTGKEVIDVKARIVDHLMKHHLSLDQVPYYCMLCLFKCKDENTLKEHVRKFSRHALIAAEKGIYTTMQEGYLEKNPQPYLMGTEENYILSTEESVQYFLQRSQQKKTSHQNQDLLSEAVQEICTPSPSQGSLPEAVPKSLEPTFSIDSAVPSEQLWSSFVEFVNQMQKHTPPRSSADINSAQTQPLLQLAAQPQFLVFQPLVNPNQIHPPTGQQMSVRHQTLHQVHVSQVIQCRHRKNLLHVQICSGLGRSPHLLDQQS